MSTQDLRKEQIALLRFEKELTEKAKDLAAGRKITPAAFAAGLASLTWAGNAAAEKLGSDAPAQVAVSAKNIINDCGNVTAETLVSLAEVVQKGHEVVEKMAVDASFNILQVGGGTGEGDKGKPVEMVLSAIIGM